MTKEITFFEQMQLIEPIKAQIMKLEPEKAYIVGNQLAKIGKEVQEETKMQFQKYVSVNKEIPWGFNVQVTSWRKIYNFEENKEYAQKLKELKDFEQKLKTISDIEAKWWVYVDANTWEIMQGVSITYSADVYKITKK